MSYKILRRAAAAASLSLLIGCGNESGTRTGESAPPDKPSKPSVAQQVKAGAGTERTGHVITDDKWKDVPLDKSVESGLAWLVSVQGADGGWGQDGGETGNARKDIGLESQGNDVANTCVTVLALMRAGNTPTQGKHKEIVKKGLNFILARVEESPADGLALKTPQGTQIQRKLGPYIDTFMSSMLLAEADGNMGDKEADARVRKALDKVVAKLEKNQQKDGSWNYAGGWAPILGTSMASRSLDIASKKGATVSAVALEKVDTWTKDSLVADGQIAVVATSETTPSAKPSSAPAPVTAKARPAMKVTGESSAGGRGAASAGVKLYDLAQACEQLSRDEKSRADNKEQLKTITAQLSSDQVISGFGSMGGEEFFSYLNVSDSLRRAGGDPWDKWNTKIKAHLIKVQNQDGTWSGQHCITGRVACTSAAVLAMLAERTPKDVAVKVSSN